MSQKLLLFFAYQSSWTASKLYYQVISFTILICFYFCVETRRVIPAFKFWNTINESDQRDNKSCPHAFWCCFFIASGAAADMCTIEPRLLYLDHRYVNVKALKISTYILCSELICLKNLNRESASNQELPEEAGGSTLEPMWTLEHII